MDTARMSAAQQRRRKRERNGVDPKYEELARYFLSDFDNKPEDITELAEIIQARIEGFIADVFGECRSKQLHEHLAAQAIQKEILSLRCPEPQTAPTCICPRCSATIVGEMNGPEDEPIAVDAERLALAAKIEKHVNVMANTSMHLSLEQWGGIANDLLTASAALRTGGWREDMPPVSVGCEREFIVAVYRASSGKAYTFAASYLNAYPLQYEHECPKWKEGVGCSGEGCDDGCPTTGWFEQTGDDDYSSLYNRLELREGDVFLGWSELPKWNGPLPILPAHRQK